MAIPQTKYVNIISAVGGTSQVSQRSLMGRVFTSNKLVPYGAVVEFTGLDAVGSYFGTASDEYKFASKYFGYTSRSGNKPQKISFALHSTEAMPARLYSKAKPVALATLKSLVSASITFNVGGAEYALSGLNFSSATSFTDVANIIQTAFEALAGDDVASFEYDTALSRFVLDSEATGVDAEMGYAKDTLAGIIGMNEGAIGAILSNGSDVESGVEALRETTLLSNNFYSFCFLTDVSSNLEDIAEWVDAQNVRYMWSLAVSAETASATASALANFDGVGLTLGEDVVYLPMAIASAINYELPNASVDFMYQQGSGISTIVADEEEQKAYDAIRVNYYGSTQQAGSLVSFYQDGKLLGSISSMGIFVNEAWLKDALFTNLLNLRMSLDSLPANDTGLAYVKVAMQEIIEKAQNNGVISAGKTLDATQKVYITQITGDKNAWMAIQSIGYWLDAKIEKYTEQGTEKYKVSYLLVYSKGDSINYVDGKDILI